MKNPMDMTGRRVLVTGASSGIGQATAILLAELGCQVVLVARSEERLQATRALMPGDGHMIKPFDLAKVEAIEPWLKEVVASTGPLNGLVHSAGITRTLPIRFEKSKPDDQLWMINFHAAVALITAFRKPSIRSNNSSIVLVSSVAAAFGKPGLSTYSASKGALHAYCRVAAMEFVTEKIRVNCVVPGLVRTSMGAEIKDVLTKEQIDAVEMVHPLGLGQPDDIANAIVFLLADTARWITGSILTVDGGRTAH
ncbi:MAG: SDR family oxidoreductase [Verrucomicrobiota bacterium]